MLNIKQLLEETMSGQLKDEVLNVNLQQELINSFNQTAKDDKIKGEHCEDQPYYNEV